MPFSSAVDYAMKPNHGVYRDIYLSDDQNIFQYDIKQMYFSFESDIWEELFVNKAHYLIVKNPHEKTGHYATIPLNKCLKKNEYYTLNIKFRIRTLSTVLNLHIKDSGSRIYQLIHSINLDGIANGDTWIERSIEFMPNAPFYDEFMIGTAQISGIGNFISFEFINIVKNVT